MSYKKQMTCTICEKKYLGGGTSKYCLDCGEEVRAKQKNSSNLKKSKAKYAKYIEENR